MIKVVLLDAVGTLLFPQPAVEQVYAAAGQKWGSQLSQGEIRQRFGPAWQATKGTTITSEAAERDRWRAIVTAVFSDLPPEVAGAGLLEELWQHFAQPEHWHIFDDVAETWAGLARRRLTVGIASNFDERLLAICQQLAPLNTAEKVYVSSRLGYSKPDPQFYAAIADDLKVAPHEILMVGDDYEGDYLAPLTAGWQAVWLNRSGDLPVFDVGPKLQQIGSLRELIAGDLVGCGDGG